MISTYIYSYADSVQKAASEAEHVLRLIEGGVDIKSVNIGGMTFKEGKKLISDAVAIGPEDLVAFKKLRDKGIELEIRKLASHSKEDLAPKLDGFKFD